MSEETTIQKTEIAEAQDAAWSGGKEPFKASYGKLMMWYFIMSDAFTFSGFLIAYGALRFSVPTWPEPDFVFQSFPGGITGWPLIFVTLMTFVLIASSATMVRAVQEGQRENKNGVVFWLLMTILGGSMFLGCQAWEWNQLIVKENMTLSVNPFSRHVDAGTYLAGDGYSIEAGDTFEPGDYYVIHKVDGEWNQVPYQAEDGSLRVQEFGPPAFGSLFYFITGFHGFHVLTGLIILLIITIQVANGVYAKRKNGYEMVEKVGLYWHFVDLVWVFVFLVFYLL